MSKYDQDILAMVALHGTVSVGDIAQTLNVTDQTVRRIVQPLVAQGRIRKVHGAIVSVDGPNDPPLPARLVENRAAKARIAEMVAQIIPDGASLAIDTGSTSGIIAQALCQRRHLTVVSNSSVIAATLAVIPGNRVFMAGTQLRAHDGAAFDRNAFDTVASFSVDWAILSASRVHPHHGFLVNDQNEVEMSLALQEIASQSLMAVDQSKWILQGAGSPLRLPPLRDGSLVVTDARPPEDFATLLTTLDVRTPA